MSEEDNNENVDSPNDTENGHVDLDKVNENTSADEGGNDVSNDSNVEENVDDIDDVDELKEKLKSKEVQNKKLFERTMKAEGKVFDKATGKWVKKVIAKQEQVQTETFSGDDTLALVNAQVTNKEDVLTVKKYAKAEGLSISDALESDIVKTILKTRAAERKTAEATNTGPTRRGSQQPTGKSLLDKASKTGEVPDTDEGMDALAEANIAQLAEKNK